MYEKFAGVYSGDGSFDSVRDYAESSDCVLSIGGLQPDFNTTSFTYWIRIQALMWQKWNHYCTMLNRVIYTAPRCAHSTTLGQFAHLFRLHEPWTLQSPYSGSDRLNHVSIGSIEA